MTDSGTKKSATGRLAVVRDADARMRLIERATPAEEAESLLQTVWEDGAFVRRQTFPEVRAVLAEQTVLR